MFPKSVSGVLPEVGFLLQRMQQGLLWQGYRYIGGNASAWPLTDVLLANNNDIVLIAMWDEARESALRALWHDLREQDEHVGLLLIGSDAATTPVLQQFLLTIPGAVAYIEASTRKIHARFTSPAEENALAALTHEGLAMMLDPAYDATLGSIDCRSALATLGEQEQTRPKFIPVLTYSLMAICILVFLGMIFVSGMRGLFSSIPVTVLAEWGGLYGPFVQAGQWWRVITVAFLHGSGIHLAMNMLAMYYFMSPLEAWQGRWRLAAVYLASIIAGSLLSLSIHPTIVGVGASGGLFGMLGFMSAILLRYRQMMPERTRTELFKWLKSILFYNLIFSLIPGIDWAAHLGGLIGGFLIGYVLAIPPASLVTRQK
ncbi:MAG TPA: rhomboid family intramembrane serine protease [Armatimonadota bacterium]|nr:rhomboid family intramembrane serine protease [Armatimonadota bacterium]